MNINDSCIVYGGPIEEKFEMTNCTSLAELFLRRLKEIGDNVILIDAITSEQLTASQLRSRSIQLARSLQHNGIKTGDVVSIYSENRLEFVYLLFATVYLGVTLGLTYVDYTDEEFKNTVALLRPRIIFTSNTVLEKIVTLAHDYDVEKVIVFDDNCEYNDVIPYKTFFNSALVHPSLYFTPVSVDITKQVAVIMRTSGTTSPPKSVQLSQMNVLCAVWEYMQRNMTPTPLILSSLPWVRPFGFRLLLRQMMHNSTMVFLPNFKDRQFLQAIQTYKPNTINLYVTTLEFLANSPLVDEYNLSSVKVLFSCSAALDTRAKRTIHKRLGIPVVHQGYGMSEFGSIADQTDQHHRIGSVGVLRRGVYGKVVDIRTQQPVGPNQRGQLMFKGPNVMKGYLNNEKATRTAIDKDGWLHTGDFGYYDENHEWFLIDRIKDIICYKNHTILPGEIEAVLKQHNLITEVGVIGIPDNEFGQLPFAYIVRKSNELTVEDVYDFVKGKLLPEQSLHGIEFIEEIPIDSAGKPSRLTLRKFYQIS